MGTTKVIGAIGPIILGGFSSLQLYGYTPLQGIRVSLLVLCIYSVLSEVLKGVRFNQAKDSYIIEKNPKLIHDYVNRLILDDNLKTEPMNNCDYIVMGEKNHEVVVCSNGYHLGEKKLNSYGRLKIGRVFQLSTEDEAFTSAYPNWRDNCLSFALAKMLRRRFATLPVDEAGCKKALDFVLEGLLDYIGPSGDIQSDKNDGEKNQARRVFSIIQEELKFVSDFMHINIPAYHFSVWYIKLDMIASMVVLLNGIFLIVYTINNTISELLYQGPKEAYNNCSFFVYTRGSTVVEFFSYLDLVITAFLFLACTYMQYFPSFTVICLKRWSNLDDVEKYIKDPSKWNGSNSSLALSKSRKLCSHLANYIRKALQKSTRVLSSSFLDLEAETILFCIKVDVSILVCLPKWIKRIIPRSSPTVICTYAMEAILRFFKMSGGRLTNGETSLRIYGMQHLIWPCHSNGSSTEAILVWHIATTLFHQQSPVTPKKNDSHEELAPQQNNNPIKDQEVALALSSYCHYLVKALPELLPDEVKWTEEMYQRVTKEILATPRSCCQKPTKVDCCKFALKDTWGESSVVGKGVKLANNLMECAEKGSQVWTMLAEFWTEMMLFIAPSDNVDGHKKILERGELITQLWALLTHAGIVTRPKPKPIDNRNGVKIRMMLGEFLLNIDTKLESEYSRFKDLDATWCDVILGM